MSSTHYKISENLYLVRQSLNAVLKGRPTVEPNTSFVLVLDCSGSMSYDLPLMREQLKKKLPKLLKENDVLSIIWFSGKDQFGVLLEDEPVATLKDLQDVNRAIDRWLKPICLTGFLQPLREAGALVDRLNKKHPSHVHALLFLSDGCDNQWPRLEILKVVESLANRFSSTTFVEYGNYADRPLLTAMAQKAGGSLVYAEDFDKYDPLFEGVLQKTLSGAPRVEINVGGDVLEGFVFTSSGKDLICYEVTGNKVTVPEDIVWMGYLSPNPVGDGGGDFRSISEEWSTYQKGELDHGAIGAAYAAVSLFALRAKSNIVLPLLKALGDVALIEQFAGCFGKQKYSEFMDRAKGAVFGHGRFEKGWDPNRVPPDDAFTVLDLLHVLADDDENRLLLDSEDFSYSRIGRATIDSSVKELEDLQNQLGVETDDDKKKGIEAQIEALKKTPPLKFEFDSSPEGYPVSNLTFNESRANVSVLVRKEGFVDLSERLGKKDYPKVPRKFPTYIYRNYAVIKDGIVNIKRLPVRMTKTTLQALQAKGLPELAIVPLQGETQAQVQTRLKKASKDRLVNVVLDLRAIPVINRKMVKEVSAKVLFEKTLALTQAQAAQKVYNAVKKEKFPRESEGFKVLYGEDEAKWLQEQGITDYNGFNPKRVQVGASDYYLAKELNVKLKGLSALPSLNEYKKQAAKGKLNVGATLMDSHVKEIDAFLASDVYKNAKDPNKIFEAWLDGQQKDAVRTVRRLLFELATTKFSITVGQVWPIEFKSVEENTLDIDVDGIKLSCTLEAREVQQNI